MKNKYGTKDIKDLALYVLAIENRATAAYFNTGTKRYNFVKDGQVILTYTEKQLEQFTKKRFNELLRLLKNV